MSIRFLCVILAHSLGDAAVATTTVPMFGVRYLHRCSFGGRTLNQNHCIILLANAICMNIAPMYYFHMNNASIFIHVRIYMFVRNSEKGHSRQDTSSSSQAHPNVVRAAPRYMRYLLINTPVFDMGYRYTERHRKYNPTVYEIGMGETTSIVYMRNVFQ